MVERIAILGGSSVYIPEFVLSIISHNVNVREIVLIGRAGKKLDLVSGFCQRMLDKSGFPCKVIAATDAAEGVAGAKYVINHIRVGGMEARVRDEKLPPQQGMVGDESLGAGGLANALRTLPVVLEYAEMIERVNPGCTFINLTNPMGICVEALIKHSKLNVIGVCDLPGTYIKKVAHVLKVIPSEISVDYIGLNHMGWIQDVRFNDQSVMPTVLDRLEEHKEDGFDISLIELFRMIPTKTVGLFFHQDAILKQQQSRARFRAELLHEAEKQILKEYENRDLTEIPELTRARNAIWYEETIVPLIVALESKKPTSLVLCIRNNESIRDLPRDASVEVPVEVSQEAFTPRHVGDCPKFLKGLFASVKESDRLAVEAARHKSYDHALQALTIHPLVPSLEAAKTFLDTIIKEESLELH